MIPHEYIEELTRRTDITELIGSYVQLKRKGRLYGGLCPFHSEKSPSFYVYPDTQSFYCFGCGAGGDAITFTKKINSIDYPEAVKLLAARAGMPEPEEDDKTGRMRSRILSMNKEIARPRSTSSCGLHTHRSRHRLLLRLQPPSLLPPSVDDFRGSDA